MKNISRIVWLAAIPLVGILGMMVRAEYRVRTASVYRLPISGYDPRDLLYGHYISFVFDTSPLDALEQKPTLLCMDGYVDGNELPTASGADDCERTVSLSSLSGPRKLFIPEADASALEAALQRTDVVSTVETRVHQDGLITLGELYLDGVVWRDYLLRESAGQGD